MNSKYMLRVLAALHYEPACVSQGAQPPEGPVTPSGPVLTATTAIVLSRSSQLDQHTTAWPAHLVGIP